MPLRGTVCNASVYRLDQAAPEDGMPHPQPRRGAAQATCSPDYPSRTRYLHYARRMGADLVLRPDRVGWPASATCGRDLALLLQ